MVAADGSEKALDSLTERLVASRLDGVVLEESYALFAVGDEVDAPPDDWRGGPVHVLDTLKRVVK